MSHAEAEYIIQGYFMDTLHILFYGLLLISVMHENVASSQVLPQKQLDNPNIYAQYNSTLKKAFRLNPLYHNWNLDNKIERDTSHGINIESISAGFEVWYPSWMGFNFFNDVRPTLILSPSLSLGFRGVKFVFSKQYAFSTLGQILNFNKVEKTASLILDLFSTEIIYSGEKSEFTAKIQIGKFPGIGSYSLIRDSDSHELEKVSVETQSKAFILDFLYNPFSGVNSMLKHFFGLRYVDFRIPVLVANGVIDLIPNSAGYLPDEINLATTRFQHFFLLYDLLGSLFPKVSTDERIDGNLKIGIQGHILGVLYGIGVAKNNLVGKRITYSDMGSGLDIDLGINLNWILGFHSSLKCASGYRLIFWSISGGEGFKISDFFYGPYAQLDFTL
jgi:hypothetical protein